MTQYTTADWNDKKAAAWKAKHKPELDAKRKQKEKGGGSLGKQIDKHYSGRINHQIGKVGKNADKAVGGAIDKGGKYLIGKGINKNIVESGAKHLKKQGSKLIKEGAGAAKKWIHTEGKQFLKDSAKSVADKGREVGKKIKGKWDEFTGRLKRR